MLKILRLIQRQGEKILYSLTIKINVLIMLFYLFIYLYWFWPINVRYSLFANIHIINIASFLSGLQINIYLG
jgi:hypothetical protein